MTVVLVGGAFGAMFVGDDDACTVAFVGDERLVEVELCVGDFEDLGEDDGKRDHR